MAKVKPTSDLNCSLARATQIVGDRWSFLILRDLLAGAERFQDLADHIGIARNILTGRLLRLREAGLIARTGPDHRPSYQLTEMGLDLMPALVAMMQWGDRWLSDGAPPMTVEDHKGRPVPDVTLTSGKGKTLGPDKIAIRPGPGASQVTTEWLAGLAGRKD